MLFIEIILSLLIGAAVGLGLSIPAEKAELFFRTFLIVTLSAPKEGCIATIANITATSVIITLTFVITFLNLIFILIPMFPVQI